MIYSDIAIVGVIFAVFFDLYGAKTALLSKSTRVAGAPIEDLLFGFALVLSTMSLWVYWGRKGVQPKN